MRHGAGGRGACGVHGDVEPRERSKVVTVDVQRHRTGLRRAGQDYTSDEWDVDHRGSGEPDRNDLGAAAGR